MHGFGARAGAIGHRVDAVQRQPTHAAIIARNGVCSSSDEATAQEPDRFMSHGYSFGSLLAARLHQLEYRRYLAVHCRCSCSPRVVELTGCDTLAAPSNAV